jgi:HK97 family phage major capsid protein
MGLRPKPYQPAPQAPPTRSLVDLVRRLDKKEPTWDEVRPGERGEIDVSRVRFRGLTIGGDGTGATLVDSKTPTTIVYLNSILAATRLGARYVPASAADFSPIPKETTAPAMCWVDEVTAPPDQSGGTWGSVFPTVKTAVLWNDMTRLLNIVTGGAAQGAAERAFFASLARGLDGAIISGTGVDAQPTGILSTEGVHEVDGTSFTWTTAAEMLRLVEMSNAVPTGWALSPETAKILRTREKATGSGLFIMAAGRIGDLPAIVSPGVPDGTVVMGDFRQITILSRALELLIDRSTHSTTGGVRLLVFWHGDLLTLRPGAFCFASSVS